MSHFHITKHNTVNMYFQTDSS